MHQQSDKTTRSGNSVRPSDLGQEELLAGIRVGSRVFSSQELTSPALLEWIVERIREGLLEIEQMRMRDEDRAVQKSLWEYLRCQLGRPTRRDREHHRALKRGRRARHREIAAARCGKGCSDVRAWQIVAAGGPDEYGVQYARRLVAATREGQWRAPRVPQYWSARPRRGRSHGRARRGARRRSNATRAGPDGKPGEPPPAPEPPSLECWRNRNGIHRNERAGSAAPARGRVSGRLVASGSPDAEARRLARLGVEAVAG
jgi:hypothetical protein